MRRRQRPVLPLVSSLSPAVQEFLDSQFQSASDLASARSLSAKLKGDRENNEAELRKLQLRVESRAAEGASVAQHLTASLHDLAVRIEQIRSSAAVFSSLAAPAAAGGGGGGTGENPSSPILSPRPVVSSPSSNGALVQELSSLASEVARVEQVRVYAQNVLRLEQLVGDLEDAVTAATSLARNRRFAVQRTVNEEILERFSDAVRTMQVVEDLIAMIASTKPQWRQLVSAVDLRVERAASSLRPAAIAEYCTLLAIIGWPPPLAPAGGGDADQKGGGSARMANPLLDMEDYIALRYQDCFMVLSTLQAVQRNWRQRQICRKREKEVFSTKYNASSRSGIDVDHLPHEPLWTVEELVSSIASRAEHHFVRWTQKPELVCALAYRVCQEYVDMIDEYLQPMIDKARLAGYSAREEWVSCLVGMVGKHLRIKILPGLANDVQEETVVSGPAAALWLHTVDQILAFDIRMRSLAVRALGLFQMGSEGVAVNQESIGDLLGSGVGCIGVFAEQASWLQVWAHVEFADAWDKLKPKLEKEEFWVIDRGMMPSSQRLVASGLGDGDFLGQQSLGSSEEFRAPAGADAMLATMLSIIDRCRSLPKVDQRLAFIRAGAVPVAKEYHKELLQRCQEAEGLTALAEENEMVKVAFCANAARFFECKLQESGEDIFFLELRLAQLSTESDQDAENDGDVESSEDRFYGLEGTIFDEEIERFARLRKDWIQKLVAAMSRGFEARSREYFRNKRTWIKEENASIHGVHEILDAQAGNVAVDEHAESVDEVGVSATLVDALAVLQSQLRALNGAFDEVNFIELWRDLAVRLDQLLVNSLLSGSNFSNFGIQQLTADVHAIFQVFKPFCVRPASFFKGLYRGIQAAEYAPAKGLV